MKTLYTSPEITVEELTKADVLCASTEVNDPNAAGYDATAKRDNADQMFSTLADFSQFM